MLDNNQLIHCAYASVLTPGHTEAELVPILTKARRTNADIGATGVLLFHNNSFFQVLEGPKAAIGQLYRRITADPRHNQVTKLIDEPVEERSFRAWTMGLVKPSPTDLADVPGLAPFVEAGRPLVDLSPGQARELLVALARGPLRMRCETALVRSLTGQ